ncbi:hypothetical protein F3W83_05205 [Micrococcus luteus]|nr:hypothetical protein [Micrococcus luteus]
MDPRLGAADGPLAGRRGRRRPGAGGPPRAGHPRPARGHGGRARPALRSGGASAGRPHRAPGR